MYKPVNVVKKCCRHKTLPIVCFSNAQRKEDEPVCLLEVLEDDWTGVHYQHC